MLGWDNSKPCIWAWIVAQFSQPDSSPRLTLPGPALPGLHHQAQLSPRLTPPGPALPGSHHQGQLSQAHTTRPSSLPGSHHKGQFSQDTIKTSSSAPTPPGPASSHCPGKGWGRLCTDYRHQHGPRSAAQTRDICMGHHHQHRCTLLQSHADPDMALGGGMGQDLTMASEVQDFSYQAAPHCP